MHHFFSPQWSNNVYSMRLIFYCTNNIIEYATLYQGLNITRKELQIHNLVYFGDAKLIVKRLKISFESKIQDYDPTDILSRI